MLTQSERERLVMLEQRVRMIEERKRQGFDRAYIAGMIAEKMLFDWQDEIDRLKAEDSH